MYKLLIADDEDSVRSGLSRFVNWNDIGFDVVACFRDGTEVVDYIKEHDVDVVLTDICMIEVSGLDVAQFIQKNKPMVKVVILSGYKEFEYAKKAIEYNVEFFLSKPTDLDEINHVFTKIKQRMDIENISNQRSKEEKERNEALKPMLMEQFFIDLMMGVLRNKLELDKRRKMIGLELDMCYPCGVIQLSEGEKNLNSLRDWKYGKDRFDIAIRNIFLEEYEDIKYFPISLWNGYTKILAVALKEIDMNQYNILIKGQLEKMSQTIQLFFKADIQLRIEKIYYTVYDMAESFDIIESESFLFIDEKDKEEKLRYMQKVKNEKSKLLGINLSSANYEEIIKKAVLYIDKNYMKDISLNDVADQVFLSSVYFSKIFKKHMGENYSDYLIKVRMNQAIDMLKERKNKVYEISENIGYKSSKYFARLFKNYTGYTPKDYQMFILRAGESEDD